MYFLGQIKGKWAKTEGGTVVVRNNSICIPRVHGQHATNLHEAGDAGNSGVMKA